MNKREINSIKKVIEHTRNAINNNGFYMPSDAQTAALKALYAAASYKLGKRDALRFHRYIMDIDSANRNEVYILFGTSTMMERQIAAVEKALNFYLAA